MMCIVYSIETATHRTAPERSGRRCRCVDATVEQAQTRHNVQEPSPADLCTVHVVKGSIANSDVAVACNVSFEATRSSTGGSRPAILSRYANYRYVATDRPKIVAT